MKKLIVLLAMLPALHFSQNIHKYISMYSVEKNDTIRQPCHLTINMESRIVNFKYKGNNWEYFLSDLSENPNQDTLRGHIVTVYKIVNAVYGQILLDPTEDKIIISRNTKSQLTKNVAPIYLFGIKGWSDKFGWVKAENKIH